MVVRIFEGFFIVGIQVRVHFSIPSDQIRRFGAEESYEKDFRTSNIF